MTGARGTRVSPWWPYTLAPRPCTREQLAAETNCGARMLYLGRLPAGLTRPRVAECVGGRFDGTLRMRRAAILGLATDRPRHLHRGGLAAPLTFQHLARCATAASSACLCATHRVARL